VLAGGGFQALVVVFGHFSKAGPTG